MYDLIGDIHGHAEALVRLLVKLGYEKRQGVFRHGDRKVIFLGDFIDRGPQIRDVLHTVRPMVEEGHALAVMGNHELNALAFHTLDSEYPGEYLRRRTPNTQHQHRHTIEQLTTTELASSLAWFRTLPLWLELDGLRVVHACWDEPSITAIRLSLGNQGVLTDSFLHEACRQGKTLFDPVETVLKGKEVELPGGVSFKDKDGIDRKSVRARWYLPVNQMTYRTYAMTDDIPCELPLELSIAKDSRPYPVDAKPVFIGHYWLSAKTPHVLADNVACLDFSVANSGYLCAYRWQGEQRLNNSHFVWTK